MNQWHRAEIVALNNDNMVKVFFLDFGTTAHVKLENIKYLSKTFGALPTQVYRGSLYGIIPNGPRWNRDVTYSFLSLVENVLLNAMATEINYEVSRFYN